MKKVLVIFMLLLGLPVFSQVTVNTNTGVKSFDEYSIRKVQTTDTPTYGLKIFLRDGSIVTIPIKSKRYTMLEYDSIYGQLGTFYKWDAQYIWNEMKQNDKGGVLIYED